MQVCDYLSPQDLAHVAQHYAGIIRYPKNITKDEFDQALSHGLTVTLVQEGGAQPAMKGPSAGVQDAQHANQVADSIGYDRRAAIYFVAEDPTTLPGSAWPTVEAYFRAVCATSARPVGGYGGLRLTTHLQQMGLIGYKWTVQTWGGTDDFTHLEQLVGVDTYGLAVDADQVLKADYGQHPRVGPGPGPAVSGEEGNMLATDPTTGGVWATDISGDIANVNGAPFIPGLNTHPDWKAGSSSSGGANRVVGFATFKDKNGQWGLIWATAPPGATDQGQYSYYRIARDGSPD